MKPAKTLPPPHGDLAERKNPDYNHDNGTGAIGVYLEVHTLPLFRIPIVLWLGSVI